MNKFNKFAIFLTIFGAIPLIIYMFFPKLLLIDFSILAVLYCVIIIGFIAGINWYAAILHKNIYVLIWSVILSMWPWFSLILVDNYEIPLYLLWISLLVTLWIALIVDIISIRFGLIEHSLKTIRLYGTFVISVPIIIIILRFLMMG